MGQLRVRRPEARATLCPVELFNATYASLLSGRHSLDREAYPCARRLFFSDHVLHAKGDTGATCLIDLEMADKEGKNFSLRQRKSKRVPISAPKPISNPINDSQQPQQPRLQASKPPTRPNVNGRTDTGGINTADLVKRRYSTRFTQPVDFKDASAPSVPSVPAIPTGYGAPAQPRPGTAHKAQKVLLDSSTLKDPNLQTEKYANDVLADATDQEIRDFQSSLRKLKHRASSDLQQNVYQNRTQFIKISKEAEKLKGEMRTLRSLMSELTTSFSQASAHAGVPEPTRRVGDDVRSRAQKQANRSSVANLEAMWSVQMHALWKNVEGSQKYLPAIPGRHVVLEQSSWLELDAATWKAKRHAHLFLLNDHLLIATRRKKRLDPNAMTNGDAAQKATTRLIADKCWALQDIDLVDLASTGSIGSSADQTSMANAVSIRCGNESFTYRSEKSSPTEKTNLLLAFRRTTDELRKTMRVDMEENSKSKDTLNYLSARDPALSNNTGLLQSLSGFKDRSEILIEVDGKHQNLRWVEGQIDDLDSEIALHRFEAAVTRIEKLRRLAKGLKGNMIAQELMTTKVDERARKLSGMTKVPKSKVLPLKASIADPPLLLPTIQKS